MNQAEYSDTEDRLLAACLRLTALPLNGLLETPYRAEDTGIDRTVKIRALAWRGQALARLLISYPALLKEAQEAAEHIAEGKEAP